MSYALLKSVGIRYVAHGTIVWMNRMWRDGRQKVPRQTRGPWRACLGTWRRGILTPIGSSWRLPDELCYRWPGHARAAATRHRLGLLGLAAHPHRSRPAVLRLRARSLGLWRL